MARAFGLEMKLFDPEHRREYGRGQRLALVGTELAIATLIGLFGGHWLDDKLGTRPWLTILGLVFGIAAGFNSLIRVARREQARLSHPQNRDERPPDRDTTPPSSHQQPPTR